MAQKLIAGATPGSRSQFKKDLGLETLTRADRVLIEQCALLALRARQMRDDILTGAKLVSDEDLVRATNACIRAMTALRSRDNQRPAPPVNGGGFGA